MLSSKAAVVPSINVLATVLVAILDRIFFCARRPISRALKAFSVMTNERNRTNTEHLLVKIDEQWETNNFFFISKICDDSSFPSEQTDCQIDKVVWFRTNVIRNYVLNSSTRMVSLMLPYRFECYIAYRIKISLKRYFCRCFSSDYTIKTSLG